MVEEGTDETVVSVAGIRARDYVLFGPQTAGPDVQSYEINRHLELLRVKLNGLATGAAARLKALVIARDELPGDDVVNVDTCPSITLDNTLGSGEVGVAYAGQITPTGGVGSYFFAVLTGSLPAGCTLNGATGAITGTPTTAATYAFTIEVADTNGCPGTRAYSVTINPEGSSCPTITLDDVLDDGVVGDPYSEFVTASGGASPYTYALISGSLPAGCTLNTATGEISGVLTTAGTYNFTIRATDDNGCQGSKAYSVTVAAWPCELITLQVNFTHSSFGDVFVTCSRSQTSPCRYEGSEDLYSAAVYWDGTKWILSLDTVFDAGLFQQDSAVQHPYGDYGPDSGSFSNMSVE